MPNASTYLGWLSTHCAIPRRAPSTSPSRDRQGLDGGANPPRALRLPGARLGPEPAGLPQQLLQRRSTGRHSRSATAAGTAPTSPPSPPATQCRGPLVVGQRGYHHGLGVAPFAKLGASKIFACSGSVGTAGLPPTSPPTLRPTARISNNSWGPACRRGATTPRARASTTPWCAMPAPPSPATSPWSRSSPPQRTAKATLEPTTRATGRSWPSQRRRT